MLMAEETTPVLLPGGLPELPGEGVGTAQALLQLLPRWWQPGNAAVAE